MDKYNYYPVVNGFNEFFSLEEKLKTDWERFHSSGTFSNNQRQVILSSWERCKKNHIDPLKQEAKMVYEDESLKDKMVQNKFLLDAAKPFMEELFQYFFSQNIYSVLSDKDGVIMEVKANKQLWMKAEIGRFIPGSDWSESITGTNAIGTALIEEKPVQILSSEHYCQGWHKWVCSSAPIRDPISKQIIGVLNITGEKELVHAHNIRLVINQVRKIEKSLEIIGKKKHLYLFELLSNSIEEPIVYFDINGNVTSCNNAARYMFNLAEGSSIFDMLGLEKQKASIKCAKQIKHFQKDNNVWDLHFKTYKMDDLLLGGIAFFKKHIPNLSTEKKNIAKLQFNNIITKDSTMLNLIDKAKKGAFSNQNMVIYGETGTGKEVMVQSIHNFGPRCKYPFVAINCGAIPKDLIASELFGYEEGAFTGAKLKGKKGKFLLANKGTIFLDEIGEMPFDVQAYLLRVLEEKEIIPVGANEPIPIDVRVICATHKNLKEEVKKGNFREDLYYRLNVIQLSLPPLRERKGDISLLVNHFLSKHNDGESELSKEALNILTSYMWPGNIRELKNCMEQIMFNAEGNQILPDHLPREILTSSYEKSISNSRSQRKHIKINKQMLLNTLGKSNGNVSQTAKYLNVSRMTVYRKMKEFQLD